MTSVTARMLTMLAENERAIVTDRRDWRWRVSPDVVDQMTEVFHRFGMRVEWLFPSADDPPRVGAVPLVVDEALPPNAIILEPAP